MEFYFKDGGSRFTILPYRATNGEVFRSNDGREVNRRRAALTTAFGLVHRSSRTINVALRVNSIIPRLNEGFVFRSLSNALTRRDLSDFFTKVARKEVTRVIHRTNYARSNSSFLRRYVLRLQTLLSSITKSVITRQRARAYRFRTIDRAIICRSTTQRQRCLHLILRPTRDQERSRSIMVTLRFETVIITFNVFVLLSRTLIECRLFPFRGPSIMWIVLAVLSLLVRGGA